MSTDRRPVVFVHGLWLHADSWSPWVELFRDSGYDAEAPGWPGDSASAEETRAQPQRVAGVGIDAVVDHYAELIRALPMPPILVGHSFGGLIVQRLLGENLGAAAVALDPAPIKGVIYLPPSSLRVASIALRNPANRGRAVALDRAQFRYGFGNALTERESDELFARWAIPSPGRPLFEAAVANFNPSSPARVDTGNAGRGPLLLTLGGRDHTVAPAIVRTTARLYRRSPAVTELREYPDRGHSLGIDAGWRTIADDVLAWLKARGF
ncbi:alpha/beta hydrolase [Jiangella alba]|uniref:Lysophospholipase, alpha-beta hydrolase superfamily n=1 Tax=Jiangella alba TaxID=561176 RepID=A0A1H5PBN5_9ACTN|nr:alpha/beta fold hydrolase [Jiangella alba]SEF10498.1 Lysophospholipase, alpha-beta hydrolase superfamily [Jiangella alba]